MRDLSDRQPCNFTEPSHSDKCCNRESGPPRKFFTREQRLKNGPCFHWNNSVCRYLDFCKFAHIEICKFQQFCHYSEKCNYFHFERSNQSFLDRKVYQQSFTLNLEEFPPLPHRRA